MVQPKVTIHRVLGMILARITPILIRTLEGSIKKSTLQLHIIGLPAQVCSLYTVYIDLDHCTKTGTNVWRTVFIEIYVM